MIMRRVSGNSMLPTFSNGDIIVAKRIKSGDVQSGDVVIARYKGKELIKRVITITDQVVHVQGDNVAYSTDSRHFGALPTAAIWWRVIIVWPRLALLPRAVVRSE